LACVSICSSPAVSGTSRACAPHHIHPFHAPTHHRALPHHKIPPPPPLFLFPPPTPPQKSPRPHAWIVSPKCMCSQEVMDAVGSLRKERIQVCVTAFSGDPQRRHGTLNSWFVGCWFASACLNFATWYSIGSKLTFCDTLRAIMLARNVLQRMGLHPCAYQVVEFKHAEANQQPTSNEFNVPCRCRGAREACLREYYVEKSGGIAPDEDSGLNMRGVVHWLGGSRHPTGCRMGRRNLGRGLRAGLTEQGFGASVWSEGSGRGFAMERGFGASVWSEGSERGFGARVRGATI
jgi:hypothetical protein